MPTIPQLPPASTLTGAEVTPVYQGGQTVQVPLSAIVGTTPILPTGATTAQTLAAIAALANGALTPTQAQADFAAINGSSSEAFNGANATTSTEFVNLGQIQTALFGVTPGNIADMPHTSDLNSPMLGWQVVTPTTANWADPANYGVVLNVSSGSGSNYQYGYSTVDVQYYRQQLNGGSWTGWGRVLDLYTAQTDFAALNGSLSTPFAGSTLETQSYTVATLPAGTTGMRALVTDASSPTFLGALTGGSTTVCPVFYNGAAWLAG